MSVFNLLRVARALNVPGRDDAHRLARFFLGPEEAALEAVIEAARENELAARRSRHEYQRLLEGPRRRS